jgi:hypothetical protein
MSAESVQFPNQTILSGEITLKLDGWVDLGFPCEFKVSADGKEFVAQVTKVSHQQCPTGKSTGTEIVAVLTNGVEK